MSRNLQRKSIRSAAAALKTEESPMQAIVAHEYGEADVLRLEQVERPSPKDGEVLVRVRAASLNAGDWHVMRGDPYLIRVMGYGFRRPKHPIQGQDVAGVVESIGKDVTRFAVGDEVFGYGQGTLADFVAVPEAQLQARPHNLSLDEAATLPVAGLTALHALRDQARVEPGQKVLVIGAAGGVGQFTVLLAKAYGCKVTGVASTQSLARLRELGADHVIDYTAEDFAARGPHYDVVVRIAGDRTVADCRRALRPTGTLVIVGGGTYGTWLGGMERFVGTMLLNLFTRQRLKPFISTCNGDDLRALKELVEKHDLHPSIGQRYPLAETPEAMRHLGTGHTRGKLVVTT
jgi:NADPH:quinone reductase-like Zn-dependent oxidoreductase